MIWGQIENINIRSRESEHLHTDNLIETLSGMISQIQYDENFQWQGFKVEFDEPEELAKLKPKQVRGGISISGVYEIKSPTGSLYIGETSSLARRWIQHALGIHFAKHSNHRINRHAQEYPLCQWRFRVIRFVETRFGRSQAQERRKRLEQRMINHVRSKNIHVYNLKV